MIIEIDDEIAAKCLLDSHEALTLLAIAIFQVKQVDSSLAARILNISEMEFHRLLKQRSATQDFGTKELIADVKKHLADRAQHDPKQ